METNKREHLLYLLTQKKVAVSENLHKNIEEWLTENRDDFPLFLKKSIINGKIQDIKFLLNLPYHQEYNLLKPYSLRNEADSKILSLLLEEIENNPAYNHKSALEWFTTVDKYGGSPIASSITHKNIELINLMVEQPHSNIKIDSTKIFNSVCYLLNNDIEDFYYTEIHNRKDILQALDNFINKHKVSFDSFSISTENNNYKDTNFHYIFSTYRGNGFQFLNNLINNMNVECKLDIYQKIINPYKESIKKPNKDMLEIFKQLKNIKLADFPLADYISKNVYSTLNKKIFSNKKITQYLNDNPETVSDIFKNILKHSTISISERSKFPYNETLNFLNNLNSSLTEKSKSFLSQNDDHNILNILDYSDSSPWNANTYFMISILLTKNFKLYNPGEINLYNMEEQFIYSYLTLQKTILLERNTDIDNDIKDNFVPFKNDFLILNKKYLNNVQNFPNHIFSYLLFIDGTSNSNFNFNPDWIKPILESFENKSDFLQHLKNNDHFKIKQGLKEIINTSLYFQSIDFGEEDVEGDKSKIFFKELKKSYNKLSKLGITVDKTMFYDVANELISKFKHTEDYIETIEERLFEKEVIEHNLKDVIKPTKKNRL